MLQIRSLFYLLFQQVLYIVNTLIRLVEFLALILLRTLRILIKSFLYTKQYINLNITIVYARLLQKYIFQLSQYVQKQNFKPRTLLVFARNFQKSISYFCFSLFICTYVIYMHCKPFGIRCVERYKLVQLLYLNLIVITKVHDQYMLVVMNRFNLQLNIYDTYVICIHFQVFGIQCDAVQATVTQKICRYLYPEISRNSQRVRIYQNLLALATLNASCVTRGELITTQNLCASLLRALLLENASLHFNNSVRARILNTQKASLSLAMSP
eukprot:TRINITY_DN1772_c0_g1_i1.p1 TRINITY_DN1772_c0_g1~~TRINITY_DN1772_c0_g1_i1.p1  ORF type:complete len:269 (+),score=-23.27 TRINITY_DN1772_c0_g1_i1:228-1034(+)